MDHGVLDRIREIASMPEGDLMTLKPHELGSFLNRARRLAKETLIMLEDQQHKHDRHERPNVTPAFEHILSRPPKTAELIALETEHYHE
jgi:hypothetical protein